jgi:hypothetical protein
VIQHDLIESKLPGAMALSCEPRFGGAAFSRRLSGGLELEEDECEHDDNCKIHEVQKTTYFVFKRFRMTQE